MGWFSDIFSGGLGDVIKDNLLSITTGGASDLYRGYQTYQDTGSLADAIDRGLDPGGGLDYSLREGGGRINEAAPWTGQILDVAAPAIGGIAGGIYGGPWGAAGGSAAGSGFASKWNRRKNDDAMKRAGLTGAVAGAGSYLAGLGGGTGAAGSPKTTGYDFYNPPASDVGVGYNMPSVGYDFYNPPATDVGTGYNMPTAPGYDFYNPPASDVGKGYNLPQAPSTLADELKAPSPEPEAEKKPDSSYLGRGWGMAKKNPLMTAMLLNTLVGTATGYGANKDEENRQKQYQDALTQALGRTTDYGSLRNALQAQSQNDLLAVTNREAASVADRGTGGGAYGRRRERLTRDANNAINRGVLAQMASNNMNPNLIGLYGQAAMSPTSAGAATASGLSKTMGNLTPYLAYLAMMDNKKA